MDGETERRILYLLCLLVLVLGLFALSRSLDPLDTRLAGVSLGLIALSVVTAIAAHRSGRVGDEIADGSTSEDDSQ